MLEADYTESVLLTAWKNSRKSNESTQTDQIQYEYEYSHFLLEINHIIVCYRKYWCSCPSPILIGLLLGGLLGSIGLAVFTSLYLQKKSTDPYTVSSMTSVSTTTITNTTMSSSKDKVYWFVYYLQKNI